MGRITSVLIGVLVITVFVTFYTLMLNETVASYNATVDNKTVQDLEKFDKDTETLDNVKDVQDKLLNSSQGRDFTDILGGFFKSGYTSLLVARDSFDTMQGVASSSTEHFKLGSTFGNTVKVVAGGIVIILLIGLLISVLVRKDV